MIDPAVLQSQNGQPCIGFGEVTSNYADTDLIQDTEPVDLLVLVSKGLFQNVYLPLKAFLSGRDAEDVEERHAPEDGIGGC